MQVWGYSLASFQVLLEGRKRAVSKMWLQHEGLLDRGWLRRISFRRLASLDHGFFHPFGLVAYAITTFLTRKFPWRLVSLNGLVGQFRLRACYRLRCSHFIFSQTLVRV